ncbi:hypothetical protein B5X24_HaOG216064 [Helicoverpa armigera]|nr:hypothetical protein B5X24_HaOG216064 [Helicoverpa armigera]
MGKPKTKNRPKTAEEIRQQKRECERRRRARIKENAALYEASKEKDRERKKNKVKLVVHMTPREHRMQQKQWRERKLRSRLKQKRAKILLNHLRENTPETTDDEAVLPIRPESASILESVPEIVARRLSNCDSDVTTCSESIRSTPTMLSDLSPSSSQCGIVSRQKKKGVQASRLRRELSNLIIKKQKETIQAMKKKVHTLQVKLLRATERKKDMDSVTKKRSPLKVKTEVSKRKKLRTAVTTFLQRDDNSKMCPGKKDCVTRNKVKKQKRYLFDTMLNLHKKFLTENTVKISFASFCRLRPFWITVRKISERDTCLCAVHENMQLMFDKLKYLNIISYLNLRELCKNIVCDINSEICILRKCSTCKNKVPNINVFDDSTETTYKSWTVIKENRIIKGKEKEIRRTVKKEIKITKKTLLLKFIEALDKFLQHQYTITHQYLATTQLKANLSVEEIFMHVDFAENYCCKYSDEIQAIHFGASRLQISLHTGVYYYRCPDSSEVKSKSFCTLSECLRHDAGAVFAHMQKILDTICLSHPIKTLHVLSDGPTAQYRNRKAFFLFSQYITQRYGIQIASWNFCEAGHGKGPMDGVGAVIKRTADRLVAHGEDIPDFAAFVKAVETNITNIDISVVTEGNMEDIDKVLTDQGKSISGTLKIHQLTAQTMFRQTTRITVSADGQCDCKTDLNTAEAVNLRNCQQPWTPRLVTTAQAALHGILHGIKSIRCPLVAVNVRAVVVARRWQEARRYIIIPVKDG